MQTDSLLGLIKVLGKGFLMGIGIGCTLFGLLILSLSFNKGGELNIGTLLSIVTGSGCILVSLCTGKKVAYNKKIKSLISFAGTQTRGLLRIIAHALRPLFKSYVSIRRNREE